ncbi:nucleotidyltransferase domain-containing protein [Paenibacillus sp. H1-7]|uniref:nucleotidyltransferase domain-containing protein n=1 Tax=Paenibacillus sp. H1-7 TaxID=2282849 RepID=UPI001EF9135C|nr:nucleotidyltransferase domain-containing protein [Paenibacillus sp. H1-7]ULL13924.1 nucleotidyltransferase domain-containing protein [Paenibacillus sp. H1-7]
MIDPHYRQLIMQELRRIEQEEQVRILYACESGSRAWGFPSQDSDYDVRFLYIRPVDWYVSIFDKRDVIERPINSMLDINGWDLKKALNLFRKSNPPLLEWLQSPILYEETYTVTERIRSLSPLTFSPKSCMYHYLHMAKRNYRDYLQGDRVRLKKYFYVLRPILACEWIERYHEMAPMEFDRLVERLIPEESELRSAVNNLLARKKSGEELDDEPRIQCINDYLEERISHFEQAAREAEDLSYQRDTQLDELFRAALQEVWG